MDFDNYEGLNSLLWPFMALIVLVALSLSIIFLTESNAQNMGGSSCHSHEGNTPLWSYCELMSQEFPRPRIPRESLLGSIIICRIPGKNILPNLL